MLIEIRPVNTENSFRMNGQTVNKFIECWKPQLAMVFLDWYSGFNCILLYVIIFISPTTRLYFWVSLNVNFHNYCYATSKCEYLRVLCFITKLTKSSHSHTSDASCHLGKKNHPSIEREVCMKRSNCRLISKALYAFI